jgi:response regulator RpfG family c-di-GMP phosphodiesterase
LPDRKVMLIVDDIEMNRAILKEIFTPEYDILEASNGVQALNIIREKNSSITIVLLDLIMPEMDGFEVMTTLNTEGYLPKIPVIVITAENDSENESNVLGMGASDIIGKPFIPNVVKRRVNNVASLYNYQSNLEGIAEDLSHRLRASNDAVIDTLISLIEHRSLESGQHILRIRKYTMTLLEQMIEMTSKYNINEDMIRTMSEASALHDIGKVVIPDAILNKPGRLTPEEFEIMKTHTTEGAKVITGMGMIKDSLYSNYAYNICKYHHERWDGRGYPDGLKGAAIPICAQVGGVADVYDALTTKRVYKPAYTHEQAVEMITNGECGIFSDELMSYFVAAADKFKSVAQNYGDTPLKLKNNDSKQNEMIDDIRDSALRLDKLKYNAVLKAYGCTSIEVDYDKNTYSVVYPQTLVFEGIAQKGDITKSAQYFIVTYVHPDNRDETARWLKEEKKLRLTGDMSERIVQCKMCSGNKKDYEKYQIQSIAIDTQSTRRHRAPLVLKKLSK